MPKLESRPPKKVRPDLVATNIKKDKTGKNVQFEYVDQTITCSPEHLDWKCNFHERKIEKYELIEMESSDAQERKKAKRIRKRHEKYYALYNNIRETYATL